MASATATKSPAKELIEQVEDVVVKLGGKRSPGYKGNKRVWNVPGRHGGYLVVELHARKRYSSFWVDRYYTTNRSSAARPWFEAKVWPLIKAARVASSLPSGTGTFTGVSTIPNEGLLQVVKEWLENEQTNWASEVGRYRRRVRLTRESAASNKKWQRLLRTEPRLTGLLEQAIAFHIVADNDDAFCANRVWYGYPGTPYEGRGLRTQMQSLVGWTSGNKALNDREAYDVAREVLWNALPDCRDCGCMGG